MTPPINNDPQSGLNGAVAAELRAEKAIQQTTFDDLAHQTGISKRTLIRILNADRIITTAYLESLCTALGITPIDIIARATKRMGSGA
ncbi:helix-turn-helix domain-containing protein [Actinobaculum massiliense]|uniref:helix-turn-helix domain-containing protein n=1 Tax=Actinobaculum massiliense TaxID=202789 RepID=UPI0009EA273C